MTIRPRNPRRHFLLTLSAVLAVLSMAMGTALAQTELAESQVLRYATDGRQFPPLDPSLGANNISFPVQNMVFDSLVRFASGSPRLEEIEAGLAESWEATENGSVWTFQLRQGVQFHRGYGELTAADVKFSLERAAAEGSVVAGSYQGIEAIETPDPYTVVVRLASPDAFFLTKVANKYGGWIVSKAALEEMGQDAYSLRPIGSGPFMVDEVVPGEVMHLVRNDAYWRGTPIIERVDYLLMPDLTARTLALINGEVDVIRGAVSPEWSRTVTNAGMQLGFSAPGQLILMFNMEVEPFDDVRVRKAFAYALGRDAVMDFYGDTAMPMYTNVPPYVTGALSVDDLPEDLRYERDVERARALLAEAGYPDGIELEALASENPDYNNPLQIWKELWAEAGIIVNYTAVDHPTYHARIRSEAQALIPYGGVKAPHPNDWLVDWYTSDGALNFAHYGHSDVDGDGVIDSIDEYVLAAQATLDPAEQQAAWTAAQLKLLEDMPVFPSHVVKIAFALRPEVDLGYTLESTVVDGVEIWETTRILRR